MTDREQIDALRAALGALLTDLEWEDGRFLSPTQPVSALVNPQTLKRCDEALVASAPSGPVQKEGMLRDAIERGD